MSIQVPSQSFKYTPPSWAQPVLSKVPSNGRLHLANLPTPLYKLDLTSHTSSWSALLRELNINLFVKRDDMTGGVETGGNKIRKLEFLLADALAQKCDAVVTIGGEQSNHCRATAAAARMVGLQARLILRTKRANSVMPPESSEFGTTGNILFDRMVGSRIYTCTPGEYGRLGSNALVQRLCTYLKGNLEEKPYPIPVGGSNGLGSWGYINAVEELMNQWPNSGDEKLSLDHVVFACGSGGTAAGICLGLALAHGAADEALREKRSGETPSVHAVGVCDSPDYFYDFVADIADEMGFSHSSSSSKDFVRQHMVAHQGKGLGYAASTPEELEFVTSFALDTGIVLDPVYSGKALFHFLTEVLLKDKEAYRGKNLLFWHTGGALGLYDKEADLLSTLAKTAPVARLDVYEKGQDGMVTI